MKSLFILASIVLFSIIGMQESIIEEKQWVGLGSNSINFDWDFWSARVIYSIF